MSVPDAPAKAPGQPATGLASPSRVLIAIPTLNEQDHIDALLAGLRPVAARLGARIIVADGGSTDATQAIVARHAAADAAVTLLANPARLQSAAVNLAVEEVEDGADWLIRIDAHSAYPPDFCDVLLAEQRASGADSVVVGMVAEGVPFWQSVIAMAQNSRFGNGGSAHRMAAQGRFVDHGHHALMRIAAYRAVGGYDPTFSHNEDAELDRRLSQAGYRIWLTGETHVTYFPRKSLSALMRQYWNFGRGRAKNFLKHGSGLKPRQVIVMCLAPALALVLLAPLSGVFALPALLWAFGCLAAGVAVALDVRNWRGLLAGFAAGAMHLAWSAGFVDCVVRWFWDKVNTKVTTK